MHTPQPSSTGVEATAAQRVAVGVAAVCLLFLCASVLAVAERQWQRGPLDVLGGAGGGWPSRWLDAFVLAAFSEIMLTFAIFCAFSIVWAMATPTWSTRAFTFIVGHMWHAALVFIAGFCVLAGLFAFTR